jgi:ATP-dependent helicase/nuclease subunit A
MSQNQAVLLKRTYDIAPSLDPYQSSWVSASAGSGKTKILTDRVLSLLLHSIEPERILCLTFTKAAANEMRQRILAKASLWQILKPDQLYLELEQLYGFPPSDEVFQLARNLFNILIGKIQALKIQTIHSFSQSLLQQFPFEAGIPPNFQIMDEQNAQELIQKAIKTILAKAYRKGMTNSLLGLHFDTSSFQEKMTSLIQNSPQFLEKIQNESEKEKFFSALYQKFDLNPQDIQTKLDSIFWHQLQSITPRLYHLKHIWMQGTSKEQDNALILKDFLENPDQKLALYVSLFLTSENELRKKPLTLKLQSLWPEGISFMAEEGTRIQQYLQKKNNLIFLSISKDFLDLSIDIYAHYKREKEIQAVLDYQDLMLKTTELLQKPSIAPWILYKLDHQIDHILVDEAQDTNRLQWDILTILTDEFFSAQKARPCSLFVVGDPKQSIYSFQGVDPKLFRQTEHRLKHKAQLHNKPIHSLRLDTCFRSTPVILKLVDAVFNQAELPESLGEDLIAHKPARKDSSGIVHLYPLLLPQDMPDLDPWPVPKMNQKEQNSPLHFLIHEMVFKIKNWFETGAILPSTNAPLQPRDILILVRKRGKMMNEIVRVLKENNIPVSGCDRLILSDEMAIQDLLLFADWALHPYDDLALATLLKSPFLNWNEEKILVLATNRTCSLWEKLKSDTKENKTIEFLNEVILLAHQSGPFEFYTKLLYEQNLYPKILARLGTEAKDSIDAFITTIQNYEKTHLMSLHLFQHWMRQTSFELKRELDNTSFNQIRIMTVHGAKGLQAPIVFLPDTISAPMARQPDYILTETGAPLLLKTEAKSPYLSELHDKHAKEVEAEHARLLYVALTRAQDQLYIMGHAKSDKIHPQSWYQLIRNGIGTISSPQENNTQDRRYQDGSYKISGGFFELMDETQLKIQDVSLIQKSIKEKEDNLPLWAKPIPRSVSLNQKTQQINISPLSEDLKQSLGTKLHQLLHLLPKMQAEKRHSFAKTWITYQEEKIQELLFEFVPKIHNILTNPKYELFFGPDSFGEVPLMGLWKGQKCEGRMDRFLIQENNITIIDFKTFDHELDQYKDQLQRYKSWVQEIYPQHKIDTHILVLESGQLHLF